MSAYLTAIVLAAGKGKRLKTATPKPLIKLGGEPVIIYSLKLLSRLDEISEIILVVNKRNKKQISEQVKKFRLQKIKTLIFGGRRRQDSVANALKALNPRTKLVLIHDSARPFIDRRTVSAAIKAVTKTGAAIVGVPVKATIKKVKRQKSKGKNDFIVDKTLKREELWEIQTPQVFRREIITQAYRRSGNIDATDDAMLVEITGRKVTVVPGRYSNIKITTPEDLVIAEAILQSQKS